MIRKITLILVLLIISTILYAHGSQAQGTNLIANSSVEVTGSTNTNIPQNWNTGNWGTNQTTFSYPNIGEDGVKSVSINITSYTDGDAKWYFDPVAINANTQYVFSDYYIASVPTYIVEESLDSNGNTSYIDIGTLPAKANWTQANVTFTTPSNAVKITIFHLINTVGSLQTDNFSLTQAMVSPTPTITPSPTPTPMPDTNNSIVNPSFEQQSNDSSQPANWQKSSWGSNNATFNYAQDGEDGTRSASIQVTSYTDGDAKWYFDPVSILPNNQYFFSDYYKSSTSTSIVAAITSTTGNISYISLGTLPVSANWSIAKAIFTAPSDAQSVTVFHLINSVGSLQVDNYLLHPATKSIITDNVPNNSMEQSSDLSTNEPLDWTTNQWGTNSATFSYLNTGHTGSHSLQTQISSYTSGDAKWYYTPQPASPGASYKFTDYYIANIQTQVVVMVNKTDGTTQYINLHRPDPTSTWTQYTDTFTTPADTKTISILHLISGIGTLVTDDYSITPYTPNPLSRGIISLTFDDGWRSHYTNALPRLNSHSYHGTFYLVTSFLNTPGYLTNTQALALQQAGNQIGSHTVTHPDLTTLNSIQLNNELSQSQQTLQSLLGTPVQDFASPEGIYNSTVIAAIKQYYRSHRSVDVGYNSKDATDLYNLKTQSISLTTTMSEVNSWITKAKQDKTWLILVFHEVDNGGDTYSITPQNFNTILTNIATSGLPVETIDQAINEVKPQLP